MLQVGAAGHVNVNFGENMPLQSGPGTGYRYTLTFGPNNTRMWLRGSWAGFPAGQFPSVMNFNLTPRQAEILQNQTNIQLSFARFYQASPYAPFVPGGPIDRAGVNIPDFGPIPVATPW